MNEWKPGLPPGPDDVEPTAEEIARWEIYFSPGGAIWHREREKPQEKPRRG